MVTFDTQRAGNTLLRISLGLMFIAHSVILKYFTFTLAGTAQYFASIGLPGSLAYVVFAVEAIAGVLLVLGIQTRWTALATIPVLIGATWVHSGNGWVFNAPNGGWEYPLFLVVLAVVVALQAAPAAAREQRTARDAQLNADCAPIRQSGVEMARCGYNPARARKAAFIRGR
ncbi:MAG: DoxX family protein, partial [Povalibacter sp.]